MYACDFEYDGERLSDKNFVICMFDKRSGVNVESIGAEINFNTVSQHYGTKNTLVGTDYDSCIKLTFDICKDPNLSDTTISDSEYTNLVRWLSRKKFLPFKVIYNNIERKTCYYDASFNIEKITVDDVLYGLRLNMETNRPFGYGEVQKQVFNMSPGKKYTVKNISEEAGYLYPDVEIKCLTTGTLEIKNETINCLMQIKNCTNGEVIHIYGDEHIITTSLNSHKICNDFNFNFIKIANDYRNLDNILSSNTSCRLTISYRPLIKNIPD